MRRIILTASLFLLSACTTTIQPGHRGLLITGDGLERNPLPPGRHFVGLFSRVDDVDVSYSTHSEEVHTTSAEGLELTLSLEVIYRPKLDELYDLATEIGLNFYDEIIGPEFRSAARGVFARRSYLELLKRNEQIENEIEADLRRRIEGKHVEIASITLEGIIYAPQIGKAVTDRLAAEQDAARQRTLLDNEGMRKKLELEHRAEQGRIAAEQALLEKKHESEIAKEQAALDKIREQSEAEKRIIRAKSQAEEAKLVAQAKAEQQRALNQALTPLSVMAKGYEALEALGKSGNAHILIGDWSKVPNFLFPQNMSTPRIPGKIASAEVLP